MNNPTTFDQGYPQMLAGVTEEALQAFRASRLPANPSALPLILGGSQNTDDIVRFLRGNGLSANSYITQENFPLAVCAAQTTVEIEIVDPGRVFDFDECETILTKTGLLVPNYEHALHFAYQYGTATTSKKKPFIVFPHEPWQDPGGDRCVLCVCRDPDGRGLGLGSPDGRFLDDCVLAGVRPRT